MSLKINLSEFMMDSLRQKAMLLEITPNALARIMLCQICGHTRPGASSRTYLVEVENWREVEGYAKERCGSVETFLIKAAEFYMRKNRLSDVQKASVEKNIEKQKEAPADASAWPLRGF
jgi:hypothetical protein